MILRGCHEVWRVIGVFLFITSTFQYHGSPGAVVCGQEIWHYNWTNAYPEGTTTYNAVVLTNDLLPIVITSETSQIYRTTDLSDESTFIIEDLYASGGNKLWIDVASSSSGNIMIAATQQSAGKIWISNDYGGSWSESLGTIKDYKCVASSSNGSVLMAASFSGGFGSGDIWVSTNAGSTWTQVFTGSESFVGCSMAKSGDVMLAADRGWNVGGTGYIFRSIDGGETFAQSSSSPFSWMAVACDDTCAFAAAIEISGDSGIWMSTDYGDTWTLLIDSTIGTWTAVAMSGNGRKLVAVQDDYLLWTSIDYGQNWTEYYDEIYSSWTAVAMTTNGNQIIAVSADGPIYYGVCTYDCWASPSTTPSTSPTQSPSGGPSTAPMRCPSGVPSGGPSENPTHEPTLFPSVHPSFVPTTEPSGEPSTAPSGVPSVEPSENPTHAPTLSPSVHPSFIPTSEPSGKPSSTPTRYPSGEPSGEPTDSPSAVPSLLPAVAPSFIPSSKPSGEPSTIPFSSPSSSPSTWPSCLPTDIPTGLPSCFPSSTPSGGPSSNPSPLPSVSPSSLPSDTPSASPSGNPTVLPSGSPSTAPSCFPSNHPSGYPTGQPSCGPSTRPSSLPSSKPTTPSSLPSFEPSLQPTGLPSSSPTDEVYLIQSFQAVVLGHMIIINGTVLEESVFQCGLYVEYNGSMTFPSSTYDLTSQDYWTFSTNLKATLVISNVQASTVYDIFCLTRSNDNSRAIQTSYEKMIANPVSVTTPCCKEIVIELQHREISSEVASLQLLKMEWSSLPRSALQVDISTSYQINETSAILDVTSPFTPSTFILYPNDARAQITSSLAGKLAPGLYSLNISISGGDQASYSVVYASDISSFEVIDNYIPVPPNISYSRQSNDGTYAIVIFDGSVDRIDFGSSFDCSTIFMFNGTDSATCQWNTPAEIFMYCNSCYFNPGDSITLKANVLQAECLGLESLCDQRLYTPSQWFSLEAAVNPVVPKVLISAASTVGSCDKFLLDLSSSYNSGGRAWTSVIVNVVSSTGANVTRLNIFFSSQYTVSPPTSVPRGYFEIPHTFSISVRLCNHMGKCSTQFHEVVSSALIKPVMHITGGSAIVRRPKRLIFSSNAYVSNCAGKSSTKNLKYDWKIFKSGNVNDTSLSQYNSLSNTLTLPKYTLSVSTSYTITLKVQYIPSNGESSDEMSFFVQPSDVVAVLSGGTRRTMPNGQFLTLDASTSYDEDLTGLTGADAGLQFTWSCSMITPLNGSGCGITLVNISSEGYIILFVDNLASVNTKSRISVQVFKNDGRSSEAAVVIDVVPGLSPILTILPSNTTILPSQRLKLYANVASYRLNQLASWSLREPSLVLSTIASTKVSRTVDVGSYNINLGIKANSLPARSTYLFTLTAGASSASVLVQVTDKPQSGTFDVFPSSGMAHVDFFTLSTFEWVVASFELPLTYSFGYLSTSTSATEVFLRLQRRSSSAFTSTELPAGGHANYGLDCSVTAFNALDASSSLTETIKVEPYNLTSTEFIEHILSELNETSFETDSNVMVKVITIGTSTLNFVNCTQSPNCSAFRRTDCSSKVNTCGPCLTSFYGEDGSDNSICLSEVELHDSATTLNQDCVNDTDCKGHQVCHSDHTCTIALKTCSDNCTGHGNCIYSMAYSGESVVYCRRGDPNCEATCLCFSGYSGDVCESTTSDIEEKQHAREEFVNTLADVIDSSGASSDETVVALVNMLFQLSQVPSELTMQSCTNLVDLVDISLQNAAAQQLTFSDIKNVLFVLDQCLSVATEEDGDYSNRRMLLARASTETTLSETIQQLIVAFTDFVLIDLVDGEEAVEYIQDHYRIATVLSSSTQDSTEPNSTSTSSFLTIKAAQTEGEELSGQHATSVTVRLDSEPSATGAIAAPPVIGISIIETSAQVYISQKPEKFTSLISNPVKVVISQVPTNDPLTEHPSTVIFVLQNPVEQSYGEEIITNETFTTDCGTNSSEIYNHTCENGALLWHRCQRPNSKLTMTTKCPSRYYQPVCRTLLDGEFSEVQNCVATNYTSFSTTCECPISSSQARRLTTLEESGTIECCAMAEFVVDDFTSTITMSTEWDEDGLKKTIGVIILFVLLWGNGIAVYLFVSSESYRDKFKLSLKNKNEELKAKFAASNEDKKAFVLNYIDEIFPDVFINSTWSWKGFRYVLKSYHRHYQIFTYNELNFRWENAVITLELLSSHTLVFFIIAVTWGIQFPEDDGSCVMYDSPQDCQMEKSVFDNDLSKCSWELFETINGDDNYHCVYAPVKLTIRSMMLIIIVMTFCQEIFLIPLDFLFNHVIRAPLSADVEGIIRRSEFSGNSKHHIDTAPPKTIRRTLLKDSVSLSFKQRKFRFHKFIKNIKRKFIVEGVSTRQLPKHMVAVHNDVTKIVFQEYKDIENVLVKNYDVGATDNELKGTRFTYPELVANIVIQRRILEKNNMLEEVKLFDEKWGWDHLSGDFLKCRYEEGSKSKLICCCSREPPPLRDKVRADVEIAARITKQKVKKLSKSLDAHVGLEIIHLFIIDLLGRDTATAKIFKQKTEVDFRHAYVVTPLAKQLAWGCIAVINIFFIYYCMLTAASRDYYFQGTFVTACAIQLFFEIFVFETVEIAWVHYIVPHLAVKDIQLAIAQLKKHVDHAFSVKLNEIENPLDASEYFFVSARLAKHFPELFESSIVLIYAHYLPGVVGERWFKKPTSSYDVDTRGYFHWSKSISVYPILCALGHIFGTIHMKAQLFLIHLFQPILCFMGVVFLIWIAHDPLYALVPAAFFAFELFQYWKREKRQDQKVEPDSSKIHNVAENDSSKIHNVAEKSVTETRKFKNISVRAATDMVLEDVKDDKNNAVDRNNNTFVKARDDMSIIRQLAYEHLDTK